MESDGVLQLPDALTLERLREEVGSRLEIHRAEVRRMKFWDTFEWGIWFGGCVLFSSGGVCRLCRREVGEIGPVICEEEESGAKFRFPRDFRAASMREKLLELTGLRALAPVASATFRQRQADFRNETGKIVCRFEWAEVAGMKDHHPLRYCRILPLRGYEAEAAGLEGVLVGLGAEAATGTPLDFVFRSAGNIPRKYTLQPAFGLGTMTPAREAIGRIIRAMLAIARGNEAGIVSDLDTEFLHDYRICLRKIRSVLSLVKGVYPEDDTLRMRKILGDLARETNRLRDLDVYLLARDEYSALLPEVFRADLGVMFRDFEAERAGVVRKVSARLRSPAWREAIEEVERFVAEGASPLPSHASNFAVGPLVFRRISKRYRKICDIADKLGPETPDEGVHRLRIECKKLRYLMEFFGELIPGEESEVMEKQLRRLQNRLGGFNDCSVQQRFLLDYWSHRKSGLDVALALGGLVSILHLRQQQHRVRIHKALDAFCCAATASTFKQTFKPPAVGMVPENAAP